MHNYIVTTRVVELNFTKDTQNNRNSPSSNIFRGNTILILTRIPIQPSVKSPILIQIIIIYLKKNVH